MENIATKSVDFWRLKITFIASILYFLFGIISVFNFTFALKLMVIFFAIYIAFMFIYIKLMYKHILYVLQLNKNKFIILKGVFISKKISLYINKIQYIKLSQSLLQKYFNICTLTFYTAGSKIKLPQIDICKGNLIKEKVLELINEI